MRPIFIGAGDWGFGDRGKWRLADHKLRALSRLRSGLVEHLRRDRSRRSSSSSAFDRRLVGRASELARRPWRMSSRSAETRCAEAARQAAPSGPVRRAAERGGAQLERGLVFAAAAAGRGGLKERPRSGDRIRPGSSRPLGVRRRLTNRQHLRTTTPRQAIGDVNRDGQRARPPPIAYQSSPDSDAVAAAEEPVPEVREHDRPTACFGSLASS